MVLLCSWRTVKDVSLLLGELTERAPISGEGANSLLTQNQVIAIGDHLTTLLAETKHRGAFEQAYVGFCKLASRLWRFPSGNLHELPTKWLNETLLEITTNGKLCATRRLICTELEIGGGKCFKNSMDVLLQLGGSQESSKETRTHAMNILRSLFRNSRLGEMVNPYVPQGIALAVQGFSANTWGERNSATLLLSALMTRVFGVPRSRSHTLNWRNKMTGRIFFQRYPTLFGVLLKHLECATSLFHSARYPVLLILGRLYPSSLEGTDSNLQCAGSSILKTRSLAASAMVALITPNIYLNHMDTVFNKIASKVNENLTHGLLLQVSDKIPIFRYVFIYYID
ncbi:hypothetical protein AAG570_008584 [Ranatra chinensis]|uniref:tRNA (32-2'-O)-methyltransferase regulator THADA n=1 Tax=Ranatra chinensis TaxID=642074 RepID=A0ABD0YRF4_9HEMI